MDPEHESIVLCGERSLANEDVGGAEVVVPVQGFFCGLASAVPCSVVLEEDSTTYAKLSGCAKGIDHTASCCRGRDGLGS